MTAPDIPAPTEGFVLTHFIVSQDVQRSAAFYRDVLGGEVVLEGEPTIVKLANGWVTINGGGGPTDDKPDVVLAAPNDLNVVSAFLNIRVADIEAIVEQWTQNGATFLTPPTDRGGEIRCYHQQLGLPTLERDEHRQRRIRSSHLDHRPIRQHPWTHPTPPYRKMNEHTAPIRRPHRDQEIQQTADRTCVRVSEGRLQPKVHTPPGQLSWSLHDQYLLKTTGG